MSKWILVAMLGAAFACERDRSTEETGGQVGAERDGAARDAEDEARGAGEDVEEFGKDVGDKAEDVGQDVREGAEDVGQDVREGAEDVGQDVEREWEERTGTPPGPTAQEQSGAQNREIVQNVRQKLMDSDLSIAAQNVQVIAEGGTVTLRGNVQSAEERAEVERLVRSTAGVQQVNNRLDVGMR